MVDEKQKVVIVGGGITGLAAAYYLQKHARDNQLPLEVRLIEASHRLGGKMQTVVKDGFVIERGPDSFLERKESAARLAKEVGLGDKLVNNGTGKSYVLVKDRLHPMPGGSVMGIPTEIRPFISTALFSWPGKFRAAADFVMPPSKEENDQSLGSFFRRRLGDEVVENLIEPLLSGIYAGDIDNLSLMATFPQFFEVEQKHGSLIRGMKKGTPVQKKPVKAGTSQRKGIFLTVTTGLQSFVEAIEAKLEPGTVLKGVRVDRVAKEEAGYKLRLSDGTFDKADAILVSAPHESALNMFSDNENIFEEFINMPSTSVATVALAFPEEAVKQDIDGTGFVVSRNSDYSITACTWVHKKWPHSTPKGKVLLRCYVGRAGDEAVVDLSDEEIIKTVMDDLKKTMDISAEPEFSVISRWKDSMPQYTVGHKDRVDRLKKSLKQELPGVFVGGSSFEGLGLPDCIDQGEAAVEAILTYLKLKK